MTDVDEFERKGRNSPRQTEKTRRACNGETTGNPRQVDNEVSGRRQIPSPSGGLNSGCVHGKCGWEVIVAVVVVDGEGGWAAAWLWWVGVVVLSWLLCGGVGVVVAEKF